MLYAAIVHCPVFKGTPKSVDESSIAGMKGVRKIVRMDDAVAVIADSWWRAKRAADALKVTWDDRGNGALSSTAIDEARARRASRRSRRRSAISAAMPQRRSAARPSA